MVGCPARAGGLRWQAGDVDSDDASVGVDDDAQPDFALPSGQASIFWVHRIRAADEFRVALKPRRRQGGQRLVDDALLGFKLGVGGACTQQDDRDDSLRKHGS